MEKRYQVFVSSTFIDLKDERQSVIQTLMEMDCIPAGMELFPAIDDEQWDFIKKIIDDCDYYIIIIGGRYGSIDNDGLSFTEKEYDYAVKKGLKVIALIHGDPKNIPAGKVEHEPEKSKKLDDFISRLKKGRLVKFWTINDQLPGLVALSLNKTIKTYPALGWVRGSNENNTDLLLEINKLRKENEHLKKQNYNDINEQIVNITDLADMNDEIILKGTYYEGNNNKDISISYSWNQLFKELSPYILNTPEDSEMEKNIKKKLCKNEDLDYSNYYIDENIYNTIKLQFMANHLISDEGLYWELTQKGKNHMLLLNAIRTDNITNT